MTVMTRRASFARLGGFLLMPLGASLAAPALAKGNLAHDPVKLPELMINTRDLKYSQTEYQLETGTFYWLTVSCDGEEEDIAFEAPQFFSNCWIDQITSGEDNANEVHAQAIYSIEFDGAGSMTISFVPIRPGEYPFYTPGYENKGLAGKFVVS